MKSSRNIVLNWRTDFTGQVINGELSVDLFSSGFGADCLFQDTQGLARGAWFSLLLILISIGSGPPSGIHGYILTIPAIFIYLAKLGNNLCFDRVWTIFSILWVGAVATLVAHDMWVA
jgi:hypothetical protein